MIVTTAVYQKGIFYPLRRCRGIKEGSKVCLTVTPEGKPPSRVDEILNTAFSVFDDLTASDVKEIEKIALDRKHMFKKRE